MAPKKTITEVDITTALRLKEALVLLSQTLNIEFGELAARICWFEKEKHDILLLYEEYDLDIEIAKLNRERVGILKANAVLNAI